MYAHDAASLAVRPGQGRFAALSIIAVSTVLAMATWFSATAVITDLTAATHIAQHDRAWITAAVQLGFVVGTLSSAVLVLPDLLDSRTLMRIGMLVAAAATAAIASSPAFLLLLLLRFLTGAGLAIVYPPAVKLLAAWFVRDRGLATGILIGALTFGSFSPHLLAGAHLPWRAVLLGSSALALMGVAVISLLPAPPVRAPSARFDILAIPRILGNRGVLLADTAYWGHMWELYAVWAWAPLFLQASLRATHSHAPPGPLIFMAFGAAGALGCVVAGLLADRIGRSLVAAGAMIVSGTLSFTIGFTFGMNAWLALSALALWGFSVVADSAQFSAAVTELADPSYVGTALTLQMGIGFLITMATIWLIGALQQTLGWSHVFALLALGPALGATAMLVLRTLPEASSMAGGKR
ncbi:MAG: MFS transporter [bacterium]|nr:MFS transporter [bacterium]